MALKHSQPSNAPARKTLSKRRGARAADWAPSYIAALSISGLVVKSAKDAKVSPVTVCRRRNIDPEFAKLEQEARDVAQQTFENEAVRRAVHGTKRIRFQPKTGKVFYELEYDTPILLRLLARRDPTWREKYVVESNSSVHFPTRAERKKALAAAREAEYGKPPLP